MKNPNGYGSVVKLSGNRRKPFWVRKTIGWNEKGHPKYETIGYYETREEGMIALAEYNKNPWDIDGDKITLEEHFNNWCEKKLHKLSKSSQASLKSASKHMKSIWHMKYKDIKSFHMQDCIDNCGKSYSTQAQIKSLFGHLDNFALEIDLINKAYSQLLTSEAVPETDKEPFTDAEVQKLWEHKDEPWVDTALMLLYTGFRISELLDMKCENVNLEERTFQGGTKTKAGKGRIVPIHSKIFPLVKKRYEEGNEYLLTFRDKQIIVATYRNYWNKLMKELEMNHTPHECRHTFRSKLDSANANKKCIDMMMGHKSNDVGQRIYTHKTLEELREAIELID